MVEFTLGDVLVASISQVMMKSNGKSIRVVNEATEEIRRETLYGDSIRLQQVLADFLMASVSFTPAGGQVVVSTSLTKDQLGHSVHLARLELRYQVVISISCLCDMYTFIDLGTYICSQDNACGWWDT